MRWAVRTYDCRRRRVGIGHRAMPDVAGGAGVRLGLPVPQRRRDERQVGRLACFGLHCGAAFCLRNGWR